MSGTGNKKPAAPLATLISLALSLTSFLTGCGYTTPPNVRPPEANVASLDPKDWYILYSGGMPLHPSPDPEGAWSFEFPGEFGHVNYVQTPFQATTTPQTLTVTFRVESVTPEYQVLDPTDHLPATFRPFFEQQGDDLIQPDGRWWSDLPTSIYDLGSDDGQTISYSVPLTPDCWSNVFGEKDPQRFSDALKNIGWVGVTFGGKSFAGHGVAVRSGSAKFILIGFTVD
jgi:hypothetical protein